MRRFKLVIALVGVTILAPACEKSSSPAPASPVPSPPFRTRKCCRPRRRAREGRRGGGRSDPVDRERLSARFGHRARREEADLPRCLGDVVPHLPVDEVVHLHRSVAGAARRAFRLALDRHREAGERSGRREVSGRRPSRPSSSSTRPTRAVAGRWLGSMQVSELRTFLDDSERDVQLAHAGNDAASAKDPLTILRNGDRAEIAKKPSDAAKLYAAALAAAPANWSRRAEALAAEAPAVARIERLRRLRGTSSSPTSSTSATPPAPPTSRPPAPTAPTACRPPTPASTSCARPPPIV